ncbi:zinc finger protein 729-like [Aricia agestis]|uniref:zinc finger protein 729-like n=1 Tax=Aricia agestis TaxID=91739 RepID=UPI001C2044EF|nr:zinc finger protein 729-like [Aricia agestis]
MALKLGKCRLCLKLGDFCSIFTADNNVQLAEMVMECARVKIYEGDGLPDKICNECIQKLSGAHIFKQQCERSDQELRRNYVPPPGFSISPPPPTPTNRQSSDSAFSSLATEVSKPSSSVESKVKAAPRGRKRSGDSIDDASVSSRSHDYRGVTKRVDELRTTHKRGRYTSDSDYEDNSAFYSAETDSDDVCDYKCKECPKSFKTQKSLTAHTKVHRRKINNQANVSRENDDLDTTYNSAADASVNEPNSTFETSKTFDDAMDVEDKLSCDKCNKTFKLKIMLKRHHETCGKTPTKTLQVALQPLELPTSSGAITCKMCSSLFKTVDNLAKHMRVVHAAALPPEELQKEKNVEAAISVPCIFCQQSFEEFLAYKTHIDECSEKRTLQSFDCPLCQRPLSRRHAYIAHIKSHFFPTTNTRFPNTPLKPETPTFKCRFCSLTLPSQELLIIHLSKHMSNMDDPNEAGDEESRASTVEDSASVHSEYSGSAPPRKFNCRYCGKQFTYEKALATHIVKNHPPGSEVKGEPPDKNTSSDLLSEANQSLNDTGMTEGMNDTGMTESESSPDEEGEDDNTCDICEKQFSYRRLLLHHKRTKHNMSSGTKRAKITLKDCMVRCLICDIEMKVSDINEHNQTHISANMKPRNLYTCTLCTMTFKSCSGLANHIKLVHRLKQQAPKLDMSAPNPADFCEVVVTKAEPLDNVQGHNGFSEAAATETIPLVNMEELTCHICGKQLPTLISLKRHVNWHKNVGNNIEKPMECFVCKETFRFQCHYKIHMRVHYHDTNLDPKHLTCPICNRKSKHLRAAQMHMNYHKQTRFKNKDYECSICKRIFQHRKVYLSHMAVHFKKGDSAANTIVGSELPMNADRSAFDGTNTCHLCGKVCDSENSLKHHLIWHKSKTLLFGARHQCDICSVVFTNKRRLELHYRTHFEDDNGPFKCHICGKGYIVEDYCKKHIKGHNFDNQSHKKRIEKLRKDKVKCPICSRYYPDLVKLIRHLRRTHPESKMIKEDPDAPPPMYHSCKLCAKVFLDERRLQSHEEAHLRKPEFFKCKFCGKKTISLKSHRIHIKGHLTQKYIDDPLKCPHCDETFNRGYDLHYHLRDTHDITETWIAERGTQTLDGPLKELQCGVCYKVLASKGNYDRHVDYHNSLRCNYCFEYFNTSRFLEGHLAFSCEKKKLIGDTETHPRKIKCEICFKAFHLQVKLDCHLRVKHDIKVFREKSAGKREIVCDYCFKVFENEYALSNHKLYHRTIGYYGCIYCARKFNTMTAYRKHKNHHFAQLHVDDPVKCEHCDETFVAFREMIYHMRDAHGDDKEWIIEPKQSIEEKCPICDKVFFNLHRHIDYHEENRCKKCGEYFYSTVDFDNHLCPIDSDEEVDESSGFTDLRPKYEECDFCFKPTTRKNSKKLHDNMHRGSGAISCRFCSQKFKTMDAFNIHAFSHRSRKYKLKPIRCKMCPEAFVKYGPFMKHMRDVHKALKKMHYRARVKAEPCVVCGQSFPNLHNHYRAHMDHKCPSCRKYFTSSRAFSQHQCDVPDADPTKVFTCDADLNRLIAEYVPKDEQDDEKYYGYDDNGDDPPPEPEPARPPRPRGRPSVAGAQSSQDEDSQNSVDPDEGELHEMVHAPIISDVLSLYQNNEKKKGRKDDDEDSDVVMLSDDESGPERVIPVVVLDDD